MYNGKNQKKKEKLKGEMNKITKKKMNEQRKGEMKSINE